MGYTTEFTGEFKLDKPLTSAQRAYLVAFNETRRIARNSEIAARLSDPRRDAVGLPVGTEGEFFVGGRGFMGQNTDDSVTNSNSPPKTQPSLWCQWVPNSDGTAIVWDCGEKFYDYVEWLSYIITNFIKPWGYTLNGQMKWQGEDSDDKGVILVMDNQVMIERSGELRVYVNQQGKVTG